MNTPAPRFALANWRSAVFIDKDGTLVENVPYNVDPARLRFMPGAFEALAALAARGHLLIVVSNQSGLARGLFTLAQFARLRAALESQLRHAAGVQLCDVLICPHAPTAQGLPACACRKPEPGMLLRAAVRHRIDLSHSWMVGDTLDDVEAGHRAGCRSLLLDSGGETVWRHTPLRVPEARCNGWDEVLDQILARPVRPVRAWSPARALP